MRILLAEDDPMLGALIAASLKEAAFAVDRVVDGESALTAARGSVYDLILLDLGLPRKDGMEVLDALRREKDTPLLIITARDDLPSRLQGLDRGADDYLIKPFEIKELIARIRAVMRRRSADGGQKDFLQAGSLRLNPATFSVEDNGRQIPLTGKEFSLLETFVRGAGRIFSRRELEDKLYGWGEEVESNAVDFLIHALRKKIGRDRIKNIRGAGWMLRKDPPS